MENGYSDTASRSREPKITTLSSEDIFEISHYLEAELTQVLVQPIDLASGYRPIPKSHGEWIRVASVGDSAPATSSSSSSSTQYSKSTLLELANYNTVHAAMQGAP